MTEPSSALPGPKPGPLDVVAIVLAAAAAVLLLGGVLFALATADANGAAADDRFRLLGQAANPFIALLALAGSALVAHSRRERDREPVASRSVLGIGTVVGLAVGLLALNGVLTDLIGDSAALFKLSAVINRSATIALSGLLVWLSVSAPPKPPVR